MSPRLKWNLPTEVKGVAAYRPPWLAQGEEVGLVGIRHVLVGALPYKVNVFHQAAFPRPAIADDRRLAPARHFPTLPRKAAIERRLGGPFLTAGLCGLLLLASPFLSCRLENPKTLLLKKKKNGGGEGKMGLLFGRINRRCRYCERD